MTPAEISRARGAEVFEFTYDRADVAQTFVFDKNDWGLYLGNGVDVSDAVRPGLDADGTTSTPGTWTASVTLFHLDTFSSAHVVWEGSGFTVEYTLDGTTWLPLSQRGVVNLAGDPDFDIKVTFAGGVVEDTAALTRLSVYALKTDTIRSTGNRTATFTADAITDEGLVISDGILSIDPDGLTPVSNVGTVEFLARRDETGVATYMYNGSSSKFLGYFNLTNNLASSGVTAYVNGALASDNDNVYPAHQFHHYVVVFDTLLNEVIRIAEDGDVTLSHLALYPTQFTAAEVAALYAAQSPAPVRVDDSSDVRVTETNPATEIYAYAWSVSSG